MTPEGALIISTLITVIVSLVLGVLGWIVKDRQNSKIAILSAELNMRTHAHMLTLNTEFNILSDLWFKLVDLRACLTNRL